ncbi:hypothetical protein ACHAXT_005325 [Thalassiosira profunda]
MSRPSALRTTLGLPPSTSLEVVSVLASGDCFFDCLHELLVRSTESTPGDDASPLLQLMVDRSGGGETVPSSQFMREYVADQLSSEQLDLYKMYASAGLQEYDFATGKSLEELKEFAKRSGRTNGPGKCFWADEFALRMMSDALQLTLLIVDDQASRGGGRKRGRSDDEGASSALDGRFVSIGSYSRAVILHRSRRQHYNAVVVDGKPLVELSQMPASVRSLWPNTVQSRAEKDEPVAEAKEGTSPDVDIVDGYAYSRDSKRSSALSGDEANTHSATIESKPPPKASSSLDGAESNAQSTASASKPSQSSLGNFYCGCAGFSSSSWVGNFYPNGSIVGNNSDRQLAHYQQHFRTVEINSTFYGIPTESTVMKWKGIFAKSFRAVMKAPKGLTHEGSELNCSVLSTFLTRMQPLGDALACILIQCPRTLKVTPSQLERLKAMLDEEASWYHGRIAFEFRNEATYFDKEVRAFLKQNAFALVMHPNSVGRSTVGTSTSGRSNCDLVQYQPEQLSKVADVGDAAANFVYLRLHGHNDEHTGCYSIEELQEIAEQIHVWRKKGIEVFCFVLNDLEPTSSSSPTKTAKRPWDRWCAMPKNCKQLEELVFGLSSEDIPDAPKKPKNTLMSFFGKK